VSLGKNSVYATAQLFSAFNTCTVAIVNYRIDVAEKAAAVLLKETNDMKESWYYFCVFVISLLALAFCMDCFFTSRSVPEGTALCLVKVHAGMKHQRMGYEVGEAPHLRE
jgi:uncharacterized membrane-anchored protein